MLGVDAEGFGHYWLGSQCLHSAVYRIDEDYEIESRDTWLAPPQVAEYVEDQELTGLSELAEMHLEGNAEVD